MANDQEDPLVRFSLYFPLYCNPIPECSEINKEELQKKYPTAQIIPVADPIEKSEWIKKYQCTI